MSKTHRNSKIRKFETFCNTTECEKHKGFRKIRKCRKFSKFNFSKCEKHIGIRKFENSKHFPTLQNAKNTKDFEKFANCRSFRNLFFENVLECSSSYVFFAFCTIKFRKNGTFQFCEFPCFFLHSVVLQNVSNFRIFEFLCVFHIFEN